MKKIIRTDSSDHDFVQLVKQLDADLAARDGADHNFYAAFNGIDHIKFAVVVYHDSTPVACGAMKPFADGTMEIKRMFVLPEYRGQGFAKEVLSTLEQWASEMNISSCVLETGKRQPEAIALYTGCGYLRTPNYGQYAGVENSVCFEKKLP